MILHILWHTLLEYPYLSSSRLLIFYVVNENKKCMYLHSISIIYACFSTKKRKLMYSYVLFSYSMLFGISVLFGISALFRNSTDRITCIMRLDRPLYLKNEDFDFILQN